MLKITHLVKAQPEEEMDFLALKLFGKVVTKIPYPLILSTRTNISKKNPSTQTHFPTNN